MTGRCAATAALSGAALLAAAAAAAVRRLHQPLAAGCAPRFPAAPLRGSGAGGPAPPGRLRNSSLLERGSGSYADYVRHQQAKLDGAGLAGKLLRAQHSKLEQIDVQVQHQVREIYAEVAARGTAGVTTFQGAAVLCLGARLGGEVRAFKELGALAIGIDLNPGPRNVDVLPGDFHDLAFPDRCFDYVYSNALDHALLLPALAAEGCRVLRPAGVFFAVLHRGKQDSYSAVGAEEYADHGMVRRLFERSGFELAAEMQRNDTFRLRGLLPGQRRSWHKSEHTLCLRRTTAPCPPPPARPAR